MTTNEQTTTKPSNDPQKGADKSDDVAAQSQQQKPQQQQQQQHRQDMVTSSPINNNLSSSSSFSSTRDPEIKRPLPQLLPQWAPITTRLLRNGGTHAWNVLDGVAVGLQQQQQQDDDNNNNATCFVRRLEQELDPFFQKELRAAKTASDVKLHELLQIIMWNHQSNAGMKATDFSGVSSSSSATSQRGDCSCFLSRKLRSTKDFQTKHPCLTQLVQAIQDTAMYHLQNDDDDDACCWELDVNMTSVQLSEYPGDGRSGYPRHCDRGPSCREEEEEALLEKKGRLLTAVYYLTPNDWQANEDGGCLRLFQSNKKDDDDDAYWDVAPYPGRLVIFRSDAVEHQVLPSKHRPRRAIAVWLYGKLKPKSSLTSKNVDRSVDTTRELSLRPTNEASSEATTDQSSFNNVDNEDHGVHHHTIGPPPLPLPNKLSDSDQEAKIFVSIAAYRDSETGPTLQNLMQTARFPGRVFVGLVLQVDTENEYDQQQVLDRLPTHEPWYQSRVRVLTLHAKFATGPCPARAMCQTLLHDEDYILQIDAHMRFRSNWDVYLLQQLALCSSSSSSSSSGDPTKDENDNNNNNNNNAKCMLTTYPVGYELPNKIPNETRGTLLVPWKFDQDGMLRQKSQFFSETPPTPVRCYLYAAGFNFAPASVARDCPYDSSLHHLFFGEELSMAVRLYAAGYALHAPCQSVCYHLWSRAHRPARLRQQQHQALSVTSMVDTTLRSRSQQKVLDQLLVGWKADEFAMHLGVEFGTRRVRVNANATDLEASGADDELVRSIIRLHEQSSRLVLGEESARSVLFHELVGDRKGTNAKRRILEFLG